MANIKALFCETLKNKAISTGKISRPRQPIQIYHKNQNNSNKAN